MVLAFSFEVAVGSVYTLGHFGPKWVPVLGGSLGLLG